MDSAKPDKHLRASGRALAPLLGVLLAALTSGCTPPVKPDGAAAIAPTPAVAAVVEPTVVAPLAADDATLEPTLPPGDLWERIRDGLALPDGTDKRVDAQLRWYASNQEYLDRVVTRAQPYFHFVVEELERRHMPLEIALLPIVESAFDPFAFSHGNAAGLWQFIPGTGRRYSLKLNWWYDGRRDVVESTRAALDYLEDLHAEFGGDWLLALAAYNSGEGRVHRAVRANAKKGLKTDFWHLKLPTETSAYVPKLMALKRLVADPDAYAIALTPVLDEQYLVRVPVPGQIDLALAAGLAGLSMRELYLLNPAFNRWATDPDGPHELLLPADAAERFGARLQTVPADQLARFQRHSVATGETLYSIAARYRVTVEMLQVLNRIEGTALRQGQDLLVPSASLPMSTYATEFASALEGRLPETPSADSRITYETAQGDTIWRVARDHGVSAAQLARWNGLNPNDALAPGATLVVWQAETDAAGAAVQPVLFEPLATTRTINYVVHRGDTLAKIAKRFGVAVKDLAQWNKVPTTKKLRRGQRIKVKVDVTQQSSRS